MLDFFRKEYDWQIKFHRFCHRNNHLIGRVFGGIVVGLVIIGVIFVITRKIIILRLLPFFTLLLAIFAALYYVNEIFTSLRKFLIYGSITGFMLTMLVAYLFNNFFKTINTDFDLYIELGIYVISMLLVWSALCLVINNKVAKITNIVLAAITGLISYIKEIVFDFLPERVFDSYASTEIIQSMGFSPKQALELGVDVFLIPILCVNVIVALICEIKGYWIDKYNEGRDISMEEIMKNN